MATVQLQDTDVKAIVAGQLLAAAPREVWDEVRDVAIAQAELLVDRVKGRDIPQAPPT